MAQTDQLLNQIADSHLRIELKAAIEELKKAALERTCNGPPK